MEEEVKQEEIQEEQEPVISWNRLEPYIPTKYELRGPKDSWKACHCGRQVWINDNWCPACGQKLGRPSVDE